MDCHQMTTKQRDSDRPTTALAGARATMARDMFATLPDEIHAMICQHAFKDVSVIWRHSVGDPSPVIGLLLVNRRIHGIAKEHLLREATGVIRVGASPLFGCWKGACYDNKRHRRRGYCSSVETFDDDQQEIIRRTLCFRTLRLRLDESTCMLPFLHPQTSSLLHTHQEWPIYRMLCMMGCALSRSNGGLSNSNIQRLFVDTGRLLQLWNTSSESSRHGRHEFKTVAILQVFTTSISGRHNSKGSAINITMFTEFTQNMIHGPISAALPLQPSYYLANKLADLGIALLPQPDAEALHISWWWEWYKKAPDAAGLVRIDDYETFCTRHPHEVSNE